MNEDLELRDRVALLRRSKSSHTRSSHPFNGVLSLRSYSYV